jgi:hypothetical protein
MFTDLHTALPEAQPTGNLSSVLSLFTTKKKAARPASSTADALSALAIAPLPSPAQSATTSAGAELLVTSQISSTSASEQPTTGHDGGISLFEHITGAQSKPFQPEDHSESESVVHRQSSAERDETSSGGASAASYEPAHIVFPLVRAAAMQGAGPSSITDQEATVTTAADRASAFAPQTAIAGETVYNNGIERASHLQTTEADRDSLEEFQRITQQLMRDNAQLQYVVLRVQAHDYTLHMLVNKMKECPSLFWFYPKKRELRAWLSNPAQCLFQDTLMMVVVCPVTLCVVPCGPEGVGWEVALPKKWVKEWGPAILFSIYVLQVAVVAGRVVGIPLPPMPNTRVVKEALGLKSMLGSAFNKGVNQANLSDSLRSFAETAKAMNPELQAMCAGLKQPTAAAEGVQALPANLPMHLVGDAYKSIHTYLTTGENAKLGKLEDQLRGRMERVMAPNGDIEWVSVEGKKTWLQKHATIVRPPEVAQQGPLPVPPLSPVPALTAPVVPVAVTPVVAGNAANSWLAIKLTERGMAPDKVAVCEKVLVLQEGFDTEESLALMRPEELQIEYLRSAGITARGTVNQLLALHLELHAQYTAVPSHPSPIPSSADDTAAFTPDEKARILETQNTVQSLTAELKKLRAATSSPSQQHQRSRGGGDKGGLMLKQALNDVLNPRTGQPYSMGELVAELHLLESMLDRVGRVAEDALSTALRVAELAAPHALPGSCNKGVHDPAAKEALFTRRSDR